MAKLTVISGTCRGQSFSLDDKHWQTAIGRDGQDVDIVIHDIAVSRKHAFLSFRDGQWALHDAGSANGTFVNDEKIAGAVLLRHNDQIRCGTTVLLFESQEQPAEQTRIEYSANKAFDSSETITGLSIDRLGLGPSAGQQERIYQAGQAAINVSHGVKNLLQALSGSREVIEHGLKTGDMAKVGRSWEILKCNLERIERLVLDMLSFSRPVKLEYGACRLNRLVDMVIEILSAQAADKGIQLSVTADKRIGIVQLDADRMHEAMMNIVINAIEAAPARTGVVSVTTEIRRAGNIIIICISDNGPGIEDTRSIFLPFYSTKSRLGTGLGLPIAKKIIELHKGTIEVQSTVNQGSSFIITIPISPD